MGWNGSDRVTNGAATTPSSATKKTPPKRHGLVAGLVVVVGAALALWFALNDQGTSKCEKPSKTSTTERIASTKPQTIKSAPKLDGKRTNRVAVAARPETAEPVHPADAPSAPGADEPAMTNADKEASKDHLGHKPTFKNGVEQLLDMVTPSSPGVRIPPLPIITDEGLKDELKRALKNIPKATEDDTEDTIRRKLAVEDRKDEFVEVNNETGMSITEYVQAVRDQHNDNADFMAEAHKIDEKIKNDATVSDADYKNTHDQINKALEEKGLPKIESEIDEVQPDSKESAE